MEKKLSNRQYIVIFSMFLLGGSLLVGSNNAAGRDAWLSFLIAGVIGFPFVLMLVRLYRIYPGQSMYQIIQSAFGTIGAKIVVGILVLTVLLFAGLTASNFVNFTKISTFKHTPQFIILIIFLLPAWYLLQQEIDVIGRWALIVYPVMLSFVLITMIFSLQKANFQYIKPVLADGIMPVLNGALYYIAYPFAEGFIILTLMKDVDNAKPLYRSSSIAYWISLLVILFAILRNLLVLGYPTTALLYYPSYLAVQLVNVGDFFRRIEFFISMTFLLNDFIKLVLYLLFASRGIAAIFNWKNYRKITVIPVLITFLISVFVFRNLIQVASIYKFYPAVSIPLLIGIPLIIYIISEGKRIWQQKDKSKQT